MKNILKQFEDYINVRANEINNSQDVNATETTETTGKTKKLFYFIGRLNPPHNGHIAALKKLVHMANKENSVPLILLGS